MRVISTLRKAAWPALAVSGIAAAGIGIAIPLAGPGTNHSPSGQFALADAPGFSITGLVTSSQSNSTSGPALLYPGKQLYIRYTVSNSASVPVTIDSLKIASVTGTAGCQATNLDTSHSTYSGTPTLLVPAHGTGWIAEPISMADNGNQDKCKGQTFTFTFAGTATGANPQGQGTPSNTGPGQNK